MLKEIEQVALATDSDRSSTIRDLLRQALDAQKRKR